MFLNKKPNNSFQLDYHKRHFFCEAKKPPLMVAAEAGVSQKKKMKNQSKLSILLTRDSVAAGDDYDAPHEKKITIRPFTDPVSLARESSTNYLPSVAGIGHSWICVLNNMEIAKIKTNTILALVNEANFNENNHIHFVYKSATF